MSQTSGTILLNGETRTVDLPQTVAQLIDSLQLSRLVLVELNGQALLKSEWTERNLHAGDQVELIRIVAGG